MEKIKSPRLVITFPTTTAAMAMDAACDAACGRLITIPQEMQGGCGFAWCAPPVLEEKLLSLMEAHKIAYQEKRILE